MSEAVYLGLDGAAEVLGDGVEMVDQRGERSGAEYGWGDQVLDWRWDRGYVGPVGLDDGSVLDDMLAGLDQDSDGFGAVWGSCASLAREPT